MLHADGWRMTTSHNLYIFLNTLTVVYKAPSEFTAMKAFAFSPLITTLPKSVVLISRTERNNNNWKIRLCCEVNWNEILSVSNTLGKGQFCNILCFFFKITQFYIHEQSWCVCPHCICRVVMFRCFSRNPNNAAKNHWLLHNFSLTTVFILCSHPRNALLFCGDLKVISPFTI